MPHQTNVLLARQPIFDHELNTVGYELLCRPTPVADEEWQIKSGDSATNDVLISAFDEVGIEQVTSGHPAYINFTEHWLNNPPPFTPKHVVVEILEHVPASPGNIAAVATLKQAGYRIALDDYCGDPAQDGFLPHVDIIKVDVLISGGISRIKEIIESKGKDNYLWLAEKVETQQDYKACSDAGFNYFQGYFFSKPDNIYGSRQHNNKTVVLELLSVLQQPDTPISELERHLSADPSLSFRLLKLVNSASFAQQARVDSIHRAITVAGIDQVRSWVTMLSLGSLENKPTELRTQSLQRAFFCKHLATSIPSVDPDVAFTAGLLSNIDAYFDKPLPELLSKIHLQSDIQQALLKNSGRLGFVYSTVKAMEKGHWERIRWHLWMNAGLDPSQIEWFYLESIREAEKVISLID